MDRIYTYARFLGEVEGLLRLWEECVLTDKETLEKLTIRVDMYNKKLEEQSCLEKKG